MKQRLLTLFIAIIFVFTLLPTAALAYDSSGEAYNGHDYNAMVSTELEVLDCGENQLTSFAVRSFTSLQGLGSGDSVKVMGFTPPWLYWLCGFGLLPYARCRH